jgi:hypothetical protein
MLPIACKNFLINYIQLDKEANPFEMMRLDLAGGRRSIFCGNSVIADPGPIYMVRHFQTNFFILKFPHSSCPFIQFS